MLPSSTKTRIIRYAVILYFASFGVLILYGVGISILNRLADPEQFVYFYRTRPLWFMYGAGGGMIFSGVLLLIVRDWERAIVLLTFPALMLCVLWFITPVISILSDDLAPLTALRHDGHVYFIAPRPIDSLNETQMLGCDSLGLICTRLDDEESLNDAWNNSSVAEDHNLTYDSAQNAIVWTYQGEVAYVHRLE